MKIAVLSGKGGTGKTFVSVNLAVAARNAVYIDCDVEEPNGRLFLKPEWRGEERVFTSLPEFDAEKCVGCRKCVEFCRFNALVFVENKPMIFFEVCHSCGGCALICPSGAVSERKHPVGTVETGRRGGVKVVTGVMNPGEISGVPVIKAALKEGLSDGKTVIIDCPPGSGCSVMESISASDCCVLVAEPTAFGFHNFKMVHKLATLLKKPCFVIINKQDVPYGPLESFCEETETPILLRVPYSPKLAKCGAEGRLAYEEDGRAAELFDGLLKALRQGAAK